MENYFNRIPVELLNQIIVYLDHITLSNLLGILDSFVSKDIYLQFNSENNWKIIFGLRFPGLYRRIVSLIKIDHTLRTHRYQHVWRIWYIDFRYITKYHEVDHIGFIIYSIMNTNTIHLVNINPETINLLYSISLFEEYPDFYMKVIKYLPDTLMTKQLVYISIKNDKDDTIMDYIQCKSNISFRDIIERLLVDGNIHIGYILYKETHESLLFRYLKELIIGNLGSYSRYYMIDSYYYLLYKEIFKILPLEDLKILLPYFRSKNINIVDFIEEIRPELKGNLNKPVKRQLLFPEEDE